MTRPEDERHRDFAAWFRALALAEAPRGTSLEPGADALSLAVTHPDGRSARIHLDNLFADTRELSPDERAARARAFARAVLGLHDEPSRFADAAPRLLVALRSAGYLSCAIDDEGSPRIVHRHFTSMLSACVVEDGEATIRMVTRDDLARWQVPEGEVHERARENLAERGRRSIVPYGKKSERLFTVDAGDDYESSRLVIPGWLGSFRGKVKGRPVCAVPTRNLVVVGGDAPDSLARLLQLARREWRASTRRLSPTLYTVTDDDVVVPLALPKQHPHTRALAEATLALEAHEHEEQQRALEALFERLGRPIFVAELMALSHPVHGVESRAVWAEGAHALLPDVDQIVLHGRFAGELRVVCVRSADVRSIARRHLRERADLVPRRWEVSTFPDEDELASLRRVATSDAEA